MTDLDHLISPAYRRQLQAMAALHPEWGSSSANLLDQVPSLRRAIWDARCVLDYGSGAGAFGRRVWDEFEDTVPVYGYDPRYNTNPATGRYALIICTDVLEHVEEDKVDFVLADIRSLLVPVGRVFFSVSTVPAIAVLPATDELPERNAHITVKPRDWWLDRIAAAGLLYEPGSAQWSDEGFFGFWSVK